MDHRRVGIVLRARRRGCVTSGNTGRDVDSKLIIQGLENGEAEVRDGAGWTISTMDPEGTMVMAVAGDGFAVVGLGACVPKP